ncbi:hypothetical protein P152DRAFT_398180 [Eremomyces bilateralis CBS 781.70]|uniref:Uncharacterized protein n=1 Tax=Eremomyces bilateralis CBS 781.70 TaxID=1392243 RepID=A0A6G1G1J0_9PEZI|nr:uncharacterized protein P152DRAFT_398180 [Eremomyces bilateralis CBS 781.70]KAF1811975.1 hypothetical protein P152DRAFT_398180 [Eremomyces bilateralis CBS 781.70]
MLLSSKFEQLITHRPNSYVPARTIATHLGLYGTTFASRHWVLLNHAHHFGMAILMAPLRAIMSYYGIIGPVTSYFFGGVRLVGDQIVENAAGASAAPWKWPIQEQTVDLVHKTVYAFVVGYLTDKYVRGVDWFRRY